MDVAAASPELTFAIEVEFLVPLVPRDSQNILPPPGDTRRMAGTGKDWRNQANDVVENEIEKLDDVPTLKDWPKKFFRDVITSLTTETGLPITSDLDSKRYSDDPDNHNEEAWKDLVTNSPLNWNGSLKGTQRAQSYVVSYDNTVIKDATNVDQYNYIGVEVSTRIIIGLNEENFGQIESFLRALREKWIVTVNWKAGMHLNISKLGGLSVDEMKRVFALYILLEDHLEQLVPATRRTGPYSAKLTEKSFLFTKLSEEDEDSDESEISHGSDDSEEPEEDGRFTQEDKDFKKDMPNF